MFAILFQGLSIEIQEEIRHFVVLGRGEVKGHQNREQKSCEQTGIP